MATNTSEKLTVYGTAWCPMVPPVRSLLDRSEVPYAYVDISHSEDAKAVVRDINNGNESVPTIVFANGKTLTEPSMGQLSAELAKQGFTTKPQTAADRVRLTLTNPAIVIAASALLLVNLIQRDFVIAGLSAVVLLITLMLRQQN